MNKYAVTSIVLGTIIIIGSLVWMGQSATTRNNPGTPSENILKSDETLFDFGNISMAGGMVAHEFKVTNGSDRPAYLRKIYTSCMCTSANFKFNQKTYGLFGMSGHNGAISAINVTLNPGESGLLEAIYDPNAHGPAGVGPVDRFIYIEDKDGSQLVLEVKAVVTP